MISELKIIANSSIVFREEFDNWALLFNPDTGDVYGLNPVGSFIMKQLDGTLTAKDFVEKIKTSFDDVSPDIDQDVGSFLDELVTKGFAEYREP